MIFISLTGVHDGKDVDKEFAWISLNNLIEEKFQSKLTVVAWINSHVGEIKINSLDSLLQNKNYTIFRQTNKIRLYVFF